MIFVARWSDMEVQFSVVILAQSEKPTDVLECVMASTTSTKTLMDGVSRLRVSFAAVKIFGSMVTSIQVEETNKRRKTEMVARLEAMMPSGGVGGAETSWQQIMGVDRNVEWQVALGEATDKEKSWGRMDEGSRWHAKPYSTSPRIGRRWSGTGCLPRSHKQMEQS